MLNNISEHKVFIKSLLLNLSIALMLVGNSLAQLVSESDAPLLMIVGTSLILFCITSLHSFFSLRPLPLIGLSLLLFLESWIMMDWLDECWSRYLMFFVSMGIPCIYMARSSFNPYFVLTLISILSIPALPVLLEVNDKINDSGHLMGLSYGFLKYVCALVFIVFFYHRNGYGIKLLKIGLLGVLVLYLQFYIKFSSRGTLLAIICIVVIDILIARNRPIGKSMAIIGIIIGVIAIFWNEILIGTADLLDSFDIESRAIIRMADINDLSNGRINIADDAWPINMSSPIIGHGVGAYESLGHITGYVHNIFLQFLCEGGIIYCAIMSYWIIIAFRYIFNRALPLKQRYFLAFLFCSSIIELLFSSFFWGSQTFWFLIGYTIKIRQGRMHLTRPTQTPIDNKVINI